MRWLGALLSAALVSLAEGASAASTPDVRSASLPNIILVLVDDLGWQDVSVPFASTTTEANRRYRTPNLEALARAGMTFTDAYAAAPVCTPSRVALLTGRPPFLTHVTNWTQRAGEDTSAPFAALRPPAWNVNGLSPDPSTPRAFSGPRLPAILREAGYRTIHVGKAHWGAVGTPGADPRALGFDVNIGGGGAGQPGSYRGRDRYSSGKPEDAFRDVPGLDRFLGTDTFLTDALTLEAVREIDRAVSDRKPFFLHFAHFAVHTPIQEDPRFVRRYIDAGVDPQEAAYASLVEGVDASLGAVRAAVARHGLTDRTIVIFTSDNGGLAAHSRSGPPHTRNAPLRSGKGSAYEGGLRVPLVVSWPGRTRPDARVNTPVILDDLFPTLLGAARVRQASRFVQGRRARDLGPTLGGARSLPADRALVWHYPHFWGVSGPGIEPFSALRAGRWKLVFFYVDRRCELYDLSADIGEANDQASAQPAVVARLTARLRRELGEGGAQTPLGPDAQGPVELPATSRAESSKERRSAARARRPQTGPPTSPASFVPRDDAAPRRSRSTLGGVGPGRARRHGALASPFSYAAHLHEIMQLGLVSLRARSTIDYDGAHMRVTNNASANQYLTRDYRQPYTL